MEMRYKAEERHNIETLWNGEAIHRNGAAKHSPEEE